MRPQRNPRLSAYFEELTGITNDDIAAKGEDFATAFDAFLRFCDGDYALSYGNDMVVIGENLVLQYPQNKAPLPPFVNVRRHINRAIPVTAGLSAGDLSEALGGTPRGRGHNALVDCYGIVDALRHLRWHGHPLLGVSNE